jgi:PAS domain S-box-containing protein
MPKKTKSPLRNQLLQDLLDNIPDVIYFKDRKGKLLLVNKAHAKGLGLKPEQVAGKTDFDFFPKERAQMMARDDEQVMKTGKSIIDKVERATRADGIDNYVSTTKVPRYDAKGRIIGLVGITRDITRRMHVEKAREDRSKLEKKLKDLEEMNKLKSEFISVVSHELRTPLAIVKEGALQVIEELAGPLNHKQKEILAKVKENTDRLRHMIEDLLDLSRIESGRLKLRYSLINLNDLLRDTSDFFIGVAGHKGVELKYELPDKDVNIFVDAERINQVISNLISNAIKFTEAGGSIEIELKVLDNKVRIGVFDSGVGISKEDTLKLFNKFMQVSGIAHLERKGLGLGLSICRELIEKHGGDIWVESKLGVGSKFFFTLPLYYTVSILDKQVRQEINKLLEKDTPVYLINLVVVNYKDFNARVKVKPALLVSEIRALVSSILKEFAKDFSGKSHLLMTGLRRGECSIIVPAVRNESVNKFCDCLKSRINDYLTRFKIENVFIALGLTSYSNKDQLQDHPQREPVNLQVKEIYIGAEMRKHKRADYRAKIDVFAKEGVASAQGIDLSEGGICFFYKEPLTTDALMEVGLHIPLKEKRLQVKGRVAWIKKIQDPYDSKNTLYKVGLQFLNVNPEYQRAIKRALRK